MSTPGAATIDSDDAILDYLTQNDLDLDAFDAPNPNPEGGPVTQASAPEPALARWEPEPRPKTPDPELAPAEPEGDAPKDRQTAPEITLETVASVLGVPEDRLHVTDEGRVQLRRESGTVALADVLDPPAPVVDTGALERQQAEQAKAQVQETLGKLSSAAAVAERMAVAERQRIDAQYQQIDWNQLEPGRQALLRQQYTDEVNRVTTGYQQALAEVREAQQKAFLDASGEAERELVTHHPLVRAQSEEGERFRGKVKGYLSGLGYDDTEIRALQDHRAYSVIQDALRWRDAVQKVKAAKEKVAPLPRVTRPGTTTDGAMKAAERHDRAMARHAKTGSEESFRDAALAMPGLIDTLL